MLVSRPTSRLSQTFSSFLNDNMSRKLRYDPGMSTVIESGRCHSPVGHGDSDSVDQTEDQGRCAPENENVEEPLATH